MKSDLKNLVQATYVTYTFLEKLKSRNKLNIDVMEEKVRDYLKSISFIYSEKVPIAIKKIAESYGLRANEEIGNLIYLKESLKNPDLAKPVNNMNLKGALKNTVDRMESDEFFSDLYNNSDETNK